MLCGGVLRSWILCSRWNRLWLREDRVCLPLQAVETLNFSSSGLAPAAVAMASPTEPAFTIQTGPVPSSQHFCHMEAGSRDAGKEWLATH